MGLRQMHNESKNFINYITMLYIHIVYKPQELSRQMKTRAINGEQNGVAQTRDY